MISENVEIAFFMESNTVTAIFFKSVNAVPPFALSFFKALNKIPNAAVTNVNGFKSSLNAEIIFVNLPAATIPPMAAAIPFAAPIKVSL